jgi:hypothetical protein
MKRAKRSYPGLNIQFPISRLIIDGKKTIETRTYPLSGQYIGKEMLIIETPGRGGDFKARIVGLVVFGESFKYASKGEFYQDQQRHGVSPDSKWKWQNGKPKWGWPILRVTPFPKPKEVGKQKGIVYTREIILPPM